MIKRNHTGKGGSGCGGRCCRLLLTNHRSILAIVSFLFIAIIYLNNDGNFDYPSTATAAANRLKNDYVSVKDPSSGTWLRNDPPRSSTIGQLKKISTSKSKVNDIVSKFDSLPFDTDKDGDNEAYDAIRRYFWHRTNGIVIEMGGMDGENLSISKEIIQLGWHRVLLEANPTYWDKADKFAQDATYIGAAVCDTGELHYLSAGGWAVAGIFEFMAESFAKAFFPLVHDLAMSGSTSKNKYDPFAVDWTKAMKNEGISKIVTKVQCVQLGRVLSHLNIQHVNLFILDVEGGEMSVLQSIDFAKVTFDVVCIEIEKRYRPKNYRRDVIRFMKKKGYTVSMEKGRNAWFVRKEGFVESSKAGFLGKFFHVW